MKQAAFLFTFFLLHHLNLQAQLSPVDVQHYHFSIQLSDQSDTIKGAAKIRFTPLNEGNQYAFDLAGPSKGRGMQVQSVVVNGKALRFNQKANQLHLIFPNRQPAGISQECTISYAGIPADGLIISKNKYEERTFFADNWPDRARQWLPCNDRPDDKASVEFEVTAPAAYQVIANGVQVEESNLSGELKKTRWREDIPLPTKVMVIGVARMAVGLLDSAAGVPVYAWVYPQDREKGFFDYALTADMLRFFSSYIGPYAFRKLANVQSKTIMAGMENASAIFYDEKLITGKRDTEELMAHEVAHQWFGNMATEKSFAHVWLSEGFATYLCDVYLEQKYGVRRLQDRLREERETVIGYSRQSDEPVVYETRNLNSLLNPNSYEKGGWILHMLRRRVGDAVFQKILQTYYSRFKGGNASSEDFQRVAEQVSGTDLGRFFDQWLYQPGIPRFTFEWRYANNSLHLMVQQTGNTLFDFPLEIAEVNSKGEQVIHQIRVNKIKESFTIPSVFKPTVLLLDPNVNLLYEATIREMR